MVAALSACLIVRVYLGFRGGARQEIVVNLSITCLTLLFSSGIVVTLRPSPFYAIIIGTGIGALGASLIKIAEKKARRLFDDDDDAVVGDGEAIRRLNEQVKDLT